MKRLLTTTACSIPLVFGSIAFAQTTPPPATDTAQTQAPATGSTGTTGSTTDTGNAGTTGATGTDASGATGTPAAPATPGVPASPASPGATGDTGTMGTAPSGAMDSTMMQPDAGDATETISGWSVKNSVMGESVYNENDEKVGDVTDVVITSGGEVTHIIVGAGGFLGMGQHDVAIPFDELQRGDDRLTLSGYTKDQLKNLPKVDLAE